MNVDELDNIAEGNNDNRIVNNRKFIQQLSAH